MSLLRRVSLLLILYVILNCFAACAEAEEDFLTERQFAAPAYYDTEITVPSGRTYAYYAQNDTLWGGMIYESKSSTKNRPFRDGGCAPSSVAMALRCVVPEEQLLRFNSCAKYPYSVCSCSINKWHCGKGHARYYITSVKDYVKYLPLVLGDFAAGNNIYGLSSRAMNTGTGLTFLNGLAELFDIKISRTESLEEALTHVDLGCGVVAFAGSGGAFTSTGHYLLLVGADESHVYFLDPLCRDSYRASDPEHAVKPVYQGLVGVERQKYGRAQIYSYIIFTAADAQ